MSPPNLKIWAERNYDIKTGLEKGEVREDQIIGFEGAALTSDKAIKITTQWLDTQGRPLPTALNGAGYTGRIAILLANNTLPVGEDSRRVHNFPIEPGEHLQVVQLPSYKAITDAQHYYIHVSGEPKSGKPIFSDGTDANTKVADFATGINSGILRKRPNRYVPFQVPIFDENTTELQRQAYNQFLYIDPALKEPDPIYRWVYRPELQFTNYSLNMKNLRKGNDQDGDGNISDNEWIELLNENNYLLTDQDSIQILYGLNTTDLRPLDYFNAGIKELVFVVGEQEMAAHIGADGTLTFDDLTHISQLTADDFTSIRLYANNDMGNTLWEYTFGGIGFIDKEPNYALNTNLQDSDNFFLRQNNDSDEIDIYYHINNGELTVADVKINIYEEDNLDQSSNEPVLYQSLPGVKNSDGSFAGGEQIHFNWDPKDKDQTSNDLPELGFYRFELEVTLQDSKGRQTLLKTDIEDGDPEMPGWQQPQRGFAVHDLIWKHRPVVHVSANETIGPPQYPFNDALRPFYRHRNDLASKPDYEDPSQDSSELPEFETFGSLTSLTSRASHENFLLQSEFTTHPYLDIQDDIIDSSLTVQPELMYITPVEPIRKTLVHPNYVFMQYWMYQPGSKTPFLVIDGAQFINHEGDWEMVQLTIRLKDSEDSDTKHKWVEPFAATASQHFYGQTIGWRRNKKPTDAGENEIDQNWVNHINNGNRVKFIARSDPMPPILEKEVLIQKQ